MLETTVDMILSKYKSVTQTTATRFEIFFSFILKRLLKKWSSYPWLETLSPFLNPKYMLDYLFVWLLLIKVSCRGCVPYHMGIGCSMGVWLERLSKVHMRETFICGHPCSCRYLFQNYCQIHHSLNHKKYHNIKCCLKLCHSLQIKVPNCAVFPCAFYLLC